MRIEQTDFLEQLDAVAVRQADIQEKQIERLFAEAGQAGLRVFRAGYLVAFRLQQKLETFANLGLVIHNKYGTLRHAPRSLPPEIPHGTKFPAPEWSAHQSFRRAP